MVVYFSGTGNSKYVAKRIADSLQEKLLCMNERIKSSDTGPVKTGEKLVVVVPTYAWRIPRSGAYSNYELPFRTFYNSNMSKVTGDSYVYIIGDARNNKNRSGEEYVKAIARKAKKAFWLNTEEMSDWNTGDSIIGTYAKYMTKVAQTTTAAELLGFLES